MGYTDFLFASPSTVAGVASLLDLGGAMIDYNDSRTPEEADLIALALDAAAIGSDMATAIALEIPDSMRRGLPVRN